MLELKRELRKLRLSMTLMACLIFSSLMLFGVLTLYLFYGKLDNAERRITDRVNSHVFRAKQGETGK